MLNKKILAFTITLLCFQIPYSYSQSNVSQTHSIDVQKDKKNDPIHYQRTDSDTLDYNSPDPTVLPIELRMQSMEKKQVEQEQQIEELQKKLTDTINVLNNVTRNLKNR